MAKRPTPQDTSIISPAFTAEYAQACETGREHAVQFTQLLMHKPERIGANQLGDLASRINYADESAQKGFAVGFFSHLERLIVIGARHIDVVADLAHINMTYAATDIGDNG